MSPGVLFSIHTNINIGVLKLRKNVKINIFSYYFILIGKKVTSAKLHFLIIYAFLVNLIRGKVTVLNQYSFKVPKYNTQSPKLKGLIVNEEAPIV